MKRRAAALVTLGILFGTFVLVGISPSGAATGERASGRGVASDGIQFSFRARGVGTSTGATGTFKLTYPSGITAVGNVTCLVVTTFDVDHRGAAVGGTVTKSSDAGLIGLESLLSVRDLTSPDGTNFDGALHHGYFETSDPCSQGFSNPNTIQKGRIALVDNT